METDKYIIRNAVSADAAALAAAEREITAQANSDNVASIRILEKLGFIYEGTISDRQSELKNYGMKFS